MRGYYEIITPPVSEPFTLSEAKGFLRVDNTADDSLITSLITAARLSAEKITNRLLTAQTLRVSFPCADTGGINVVSRAPIAAIDSFETWNGSAFEAFTAYFLRQSNGFPTICYTSIPSNYSDVPFNIRVQFQAGYSILPDDLIVALKQHISFLYENRGDVQAIGKLAVPNEANFIYRQYRILNTYG